MAGAGVARDRYRPVPRGLVAWPLALAAAGRPRHPPRCLLPADGGRVRAGVDAARAEPHRGSATARPQFRPAASARHRDRGRDRGPDRRFLFSRLVACPFERALRAAKTLRAGAPMPRLALRGPLAGRVLGGVGVGGAFFALRWLGLEGGGGALGWSSCVRLT